MVGKKVVNFFRFCDLVIFTGILFVELVESGATIAASVESLVIPTVGYSSTFIREIFLSS